MVIRRFSSRREHLDQSFLAARLQGAKAYDRIAGYFSSSLLEVVGEALDTVEGTIRIVCNSDLHPQDVQTAKAAKMALWQSWTRSQPENLLDTSGGLLARERFRRMYDLLASGKLRVKVLPDQAFGLIHGKAGIITLANGDKTSFIGSANESRQAWQLNYELVWEDASSEAVAWVQEEFDALWNHPQAAPLSEMVIQDIQRIAQRHVIHSLDDWTPDPATAIIETPVYRREVGLWEHQKYFAKIVFDAHQGPAGKARFVLADQVGLGKTLQLAMSAKLMALTGDKPILIICPKTLMWQWQDEMHDLLDMPSAVWDGKRWVDENGIEYPVIGAEGVRKCPRRVGIISSGLISYGSEPVWELLKLSYDCIILDESHRARRRNLGVGKEGEAPEPNNLLAFMYQIAERTRSLLLATATPVQLQPIEAWDLLDILSRGDESVLGNQHSRWRHGDAALDYVMGYEPLSKSEDELWEWTRNPFPNSQEHRDFDIIRSHLNIPDGQAILPGNLLTEMRPPDRSRLKRLYPRIFDEHHPFILRIIRRTRQQLEETIDPETNEPLLKPIGVELYGEADTDAIRLPLYLKDAYGHAEEFCRHFGKGSGFIKTLLLRRVGSSIYAGMQTAKRMLGEWDPFTSTDEDQETETDAEAARAAAQTRLDLTDEQCALLEKFIAALEQNKERDPKYAVVVKCLRDWDWLSRGCIIFSQYWDSIWWLIGQLAEEFPEEPIGLYSGATKSGLMLGGRWTPMPRETLKQRVREGSLRLLLGTDAASEGLNLQRLSALINLDLPWNPTRLEQRKGRIQRIGQLSDTVLIYNLRYKDSVEDRVHELLSTRLKNIYTLFGQIPDVLEDAWIAIALGEKERAQKIIDAVPEQHPFDIRYTEVEHVDWESCAEVLSKVEKRRVLSSGWS
ncbi:MAG: hypothetical protein JW862_07495 [Anaerolineales bacterium]|nr:hypothetical protein [Anaerolineales bacterium]